MLILSPQTVRFATLPIEGVTRLAIDRAPARLVEEHSDESAFAAFVDVPEQRVTIKLVQTLAASDIPGPLPGSEGLLEVWAAFNRSQSGRIKVEARAVITAVHYDLPPRSAKAPEQATRTLTLAAYVSDSKGDPVTIFDASTGPD